MIVLAKFYQIIASVWPRFWLVPTFNHLWQASWSHFQENPFILQLWSFHFKAHLCLFQAQKASNFPVLFSYLKHQVEWTELYIPFIQIFLQSLLLSIWACLLKTYAFQQFSFQAVLTHINLKVDNWSVLQLREAWLTFSKCIWWLSCTFAQVKQGWSRILEILQRADPLRQSRLQ